MHQAVLSEFDQYLELECGRSVHTRRAYLGDLRSLGEFLGDDATIADLDLMTLRSWLAGPDIYPDNSLHGFQIIALVVLFFIIGGVASVLALVAIFSNSGRWQGALALAIGVAGWIAIMANVG